MRVTSCNASSKGVVFSGSQGGFTLRVIERYSFASSFVSLQYESTLRGYVWGTSSKSLVSLTRKENFVQITHWQSLSSINLQPHWKHFSRNCFGEKTCRDVSFLASFFATRRKIRQKISATRKNTGTTITQRCRTCAGNSSHGKLPTKSVAIFDSLMASSFAISEVKLCNSLRGELAWQKYIPYDHNYDWCHHFLRFSLKSWDFSFKYFRFDIPKIILNFQAILDENRVSWNFRCLKFWTPWYF